MIESRKSRPSPPWMPNWNSRNKLVASLARRPRSAASQIRQSLSGARDSDKIRLSSKFLSRRIMSNLKAQNILKDRGLRQAQQLHTKRQTSRIKCEIMTRRIPTTHRWEA